MSKYVYSLVKELNVDYDRVNYLCKDNLLHVRLRDFGKKKEIISGLEDKVTFYIVWIMNKMLSTYLDVSIFDISNKDKYKEIFDSCLIKFKESEDCRVLAFCVRQMYPSCKGLSILPRYSKLDKYDTVLSLFGNVNTSTSSTFEQFIGISIYKYLCDESVFLVVDAKKKVNCTKYLKKYAKKSKNSLWE